MIFFLMEKLAMREGERGREKRNTTVMNLGALVWIIIEEVTSKK